MMHNNGIDTNGQEKKNAIINSFVDFVRERGRKLAVDKMKDRDSIIQEWRNNLPS